MLIIKSFALSILAILCTSCGENKPKLVKVTGKISFKSKPLTAGSIYFHPASTNSFTNDNPSSLLQEDGPRRQLMPHAIESCQTVINPG